MTELTFQDLFPKMEEPQIRFIYKNYEGGLLTDNDVSKMEIAEFTRLNKQTESWLEMAKAEEENRVEQRKLWMLSCIKGVLEEQGKHPSDDLLDDAAMLAISHCILPSFNPTRNGWFIDMLCCFCDGEPYENGEYRITYK